MWALTGTAACLFLPIKPFRHNGAVLAYIEKVIFFLYTVLLIHFGSLRKYLGLTVLLVDLLFSSSSKVVKELRDLASSPELSL